MARVHELAGLSIEQHNSPNRGGAMSGHRGVVLHIAQGTYRGTISWQMNPNQRYADGTPVNTCSTWIVGKERGEWAQMVDTSEIAWAHRGGSRTWLSIELEGFAPAAPTDWQVEACAQLLAWSAKTYGHRIARADHEGERGLGHHSMDREQFGVEWGHEACPGSGVIGAKNAIVARAEEIAEGEDDMQPKDQLTIPEWVTQRWPGLGRKITIHTALNGGYVYAKMAAEAADAQEAKLDALLRLHGGEGAEQILAVIHQRADEAAAQRVQLAEAAGEERAALAETLGPALAEELRAAAADLPAEAAEAVAGIVDGVVAGALRRVSLTVAPTVEPAGDET